MRTKRLWMGSEQILALLVRLLWAAALALPAFGAQAAFVFTSLYSFTGTNDGSNPRAGLVQGTDGYFYGTTYGGGVSGHGTVFKISTNGVPTVLYSFTGANDGATPQAALIQGRDGNFYGTTSGGGTNNSGTVFKISSDGVLTSLHLFTITDGASPFGGLVPGRDGNFYGTTFTGGTTSTLFFGTVFKISTNGVLTGLYSFTGTNSGANPYAGLVQGKDGYFYGTTDNGGLGGDGTVFKISTNGVPTVLYSFTGTNDGASPLAELVQGDDGNFYGTTSGGGTNNVGTVFKIGTNGTLNILHSFTDGKDGANPQAGLVQGSDGDFYGTAYYGGTVDYGTLFKISTNGVLTVLYSFTGTNDGANPAAALVQGSDGYFYGTTYGGGTNGAGTVFRLTIVPEPPQLTIIPSVSNLILTWPTNFTGYILQSTTNLGSTALWTTNSTVRVVVKGLNTVTNPILGTQQFYRLGQ